MIGEMRKHTNCRHTKVERPASIQGGKNSLDPTYSIAPYDPQRDDDPFLNNLQAAHTGGSRRRMTR